MKGAVPELGVAFCKVPEVADLGLQTADSPLGAVVRAAVGIAVGVAV